MLKVRLPFSGVAALLAYVITRTNWIAQTAGIIMELAIAIVLFRKLISEKEFDYDSFIGQLLLQYTMIPEIGLTSLLHLISARIVSYAVFIMLTGWWLIIPILLYISTVVHYLPDTKTPLS